MSTEQLMMMINEFVDGELPIEKETFLFLELGNDEVAREYFKKVNSLKVVTSEQTETFPSELDSKILNEIKAGHSASVFQQTKSRLVAYVSYLILIISIAGGYFLYDQNVYQEQQLKISETKIEQQQKVLDLLMSNQFTPITVEPNYKNEVVIQATL